jgi:hypothetical protein
VREEWSTEDLVGSWTLVNGDWSLVANKSSAPRLAFALQLEFFEVAARFPAPSTVAAPNQHHPGRPLGAPRDQFNRYGGRAAAADRR